MKPEEYAEYNQRMIRVIADELQIQINQLRAKIMSLERKITELRDNKCKT